MLIVMNAQATAADIERVCKKIESLGFRPHPMPGAQKCAIGITGNPGPVDPAEFEDFPGVAEAIRVSKPYKLVSREVKCRWVDRSRSFAGARVRWKAANRFWKARAP
jgi:3-deoxy-7-phosphoheptulonate synthase